VQPHGAPQIRLFARVLLQVTLHGVPLIPPPAQVLRAKPHGVPLILFHVQAHNSKTGYHPQALLALKNGANPTQKLVICIVLPQVTRHGVKLIQCLVLLLQAHPHGVYKIQLLVPVLQALNNGVLAIQLHAMNILAQALQLGAYKTLTNVLKTPYTCLDVPELMKIMP
jgi:hypothetical protein